MKLTKITTLLFLLTIIFNSYSQQSESDEKFDYSTIGHFTLKNYDILNENPLSTFKIPNYGTRFVLKNKIKHPTNDYNIYLIDILNYSEKDKNGKLISYDLKGDNTYVNVDDNNKLFWIKAEEFERLENEKWIVKRYHMKPKFAYGASFSVPFKIRPETSDLNMKITPELTLGGYFGLKQRLSRYNDIYLYIPVITLGVTTLGINEDNVIKETDSTQETQDGLVLGRTFTVGTIFEYKSFQIGLIGGFDKAGGEIGKNWVYNDKFWYSFSIGYSFFGKESGK
jgi:hypothetical protein